MYKAIFELSPNRADFMSLLFSRRRPPGLNAGSTAEALFKAYRMVEGDPSYFANNYERKSSTA